MSSEQPKGGHCINYSPKHDHPESKLYCGIGTAISPCWSKGLEAQGYVVLSVVDSYFVGARSYENCSVHPFLVKLEHLSARSVLKTHTPCYVSHGTHTMTRVSYFPNFKRLLLLSSKIHAFLEYNLLLSEQHVVSKTWGWIMAVMDGLVWLDNKKWLITQRVSLLSATHHKKTG